MYRSAAIAAFLLSSMPCAFAQVELKNYADANGYIDVQKLTCAQLANTYQEDADFSHLVQRLVQWPGKEALSRSATAQDGMKSSFTARPTARKSFRQLMSS